MKPPVAPSAAFLRPRLPCSTVRACDDAADHCCHCLVLTRSRSALTWGGGLTGSPRATLPQPPNTIAMFYCRVLVPLVSPTDAKTFTITSNNMAVPEFVIFYTAT